MVRKTKFEKFHTSYDENMVKFFTKYQKLEKSQKDIPFEMNMSDLTDFIVDDTKQMRDLIRIAAYTVISANDYIKFIKK